MQDINEHNSVIAVIRKRYCHAVEQTNWNLGVAPSQDVYPAYLYIRTIVHYQARQQTIPAANI
jgi:hypothetical protein